MRLKASFSLIFIMSHKKHQTERLYLNVPEKKIRIGLYHNCAINKLANS